MKRLLLVGLLSLSVLSIGASALPTDNSQSLTSETTIALVGSDVVRATCDGGLVISEQTNNSALLTCNATATVTPTNTATSTATATNTPTATSIPASPTNTPQATPVVINAGIWLSQAEIQALPMSGVAWDNVKSKAFSDWGVADLKNLNSNHDVLTLAGALYYARTGDTAIRTKTANAIMSAIGTEVGGRTLEPSRNIVSYVISADLINLAAYDTGKNNTFKSWLSSVRTEVLDGRTIISTQEDRPNNWGTHAGATRAAIDRYIGDTADLDRTAKVFRGWLGDRSVYAGFSYGDLWWQSDPPHPVGINPLGSTIQGHNVDGVIPDDMRRGGAFTWPPFKENYTWESLQGATVEAQILSRAGYDVWSWSDRALLRAVTWLYGVDAYPPTGDDVYIPWIINKAYHTSFATVSPVAIGKNCSYTDWTHK